MSEFAPWFKAVQPIPFGSMVKPVERTKPKAEGKRSFLAKTNRRRFACLKAAEQALELLPGPGESLHCIMTGFYDLMHLLIVVLDRLGSPAVSMRIATLSLSRRNVQEMVALYDSGKVQSIDLLTSDFFRKHDDEIFAELVNDFTKRGQRVGATRSHCKLVTIALEDGRRYVLEGSANLRTNRNQEQFALTHDAELHGWYAGWIDEMVTQHEVRPKDCAETS